MIRLGAVVSSVMPGKLSGWGRRQWGRERGRCTQMGVSDHPDTGIFLAIAGALVKITFFGDSLPVGAAASPAGQIVDRRFPSRSAPSRTT